MAKEITMRVAAETVPRRMAVHRIQRLLRNISKTPFLNKIVPDGRLVPERKSLTLYHIGEGARPDRSGTLTLSYPRKRLACCRALTLSNHLVQ